MENKMVRLRPIEKNDLNNLNKWKNDERIYKFLGGGFQPVSINQQEKWLDNLMDLTGNSRRFIIEDTSKKAIGMIGLYDINWIHRTCEIGIYIGEIEEQKKGYGKEAYEIIEKYALEYLNIRKINLKVVSSNKKAVYFWEKVGFLKVGEFHEERFIQGEYHNLTLMEKFIRKEI